MLDYMTLIRIDIGPVQIYAESIKLTKLVLYVGKDQMVTRK